jgi:PHP family Zn ribbon phosphoesterase
LKHRAICPVCGKRVVVGVASRIAQLSDRTDITQRPNRRDFYSIIPLPEILAEITGAGESSKKVKQLYYDLLAKCGSEFDILLNHPLDHIYKTGGATVAEAIKRMRNGEVIIKEGFDGEYGVIKVFKPGEAAQFNANESMYLNTPENQKKQEQKLLNFDLAEYRRLVEEHYTLEEADAIDKNNKEQDTQLKLF